MEDVLRVAKFMKIQPLKGVNTYTGEEYYYYNNADLQDLKDRLQQLLEK